MDEGLIFLKGACSDRYDGRRQEADCNANGAGAPRSKVDGAHGGVFGLAV
jgi:hypothetical protein